MKKEPFILWLLIILLTGCGESRLNFERSLPSPGGSTNLYFNLNKGEPYYLVFYDGEIILDWSKMGFKTTKINLADGMLKCNDHQDYTNADDTVLYAIFGSNNFNEMTVCLAHDSIPELGWQVQFRAYDEGIAFRYTIFDERNTIASWTELTEVTPRAEKHSWQVHKDSSWIDPRTLKTIDVPAQFRFNYATGIRILEIPDLGNVSLKRKMEPDSSLAYSFRSNIKGRKDRIEISTPWRVIQIASYGE